MEILRTKRLILREFELNDIDSFDRIYSPEIIKMAENNNCLFEEKQFIEYENYEPLIHLGLWILVEKNTGEIIGRCGLDLRKINFKECVEISYFIIPEKQGRGYATEIVKKIVQYVLETMKNLKVVALIEEENIKSIRVAEKAGMFFQNKIMCGKRLVNIYCTK